MSYFGDSDFLLDVAAGKVDGHETRVLIGSLPSSAVNTYEDLWSEGGILVQPTAAESWEIVSDNANDTAGGTGAQTVVVTYLDDTLTTQVSVASMNGTTPVALNSDHFRVENSNGASGGRTVVIAAGSSGSNEGKITVRVAGGGATRTSILPGVGISENGQYTVPTGKTGYATQNLLFFPKNDDGQFQTSIKPNIPGSAFISSGAIPFYQNAFSQPFKSSFVLTEGTTVAFQGRSTNGGTNLVWIFEFILIDDGA